MTIFQRLNKERGLTIVQVTHEDYIARHGRRIIHLLDGGIEREQVLEQTPEAWQSEVAATGSPVQSSIPEEVLFS